MIVDWSALIGPPSGLTDPSRKDDADLLVLTKAMLRELASCLFMRFKYLRSPPWSFSRASSPEGAAEFLRQYAAHPRGQHDALTVRLDCPRHSARNHPQSLTASRFVFPVGGGWGTATAVAGGDSSRGIGAVL